MTPKPGPNPETHRPPASGRRALWLVWALALACVSPAVADELMRNGQWQDITAVGIQDSELVYRNNAGGERSIPLDEIESLKLDDDAAFYDAVEAFKAEDYRAAQRQFTEIAEQARTDWVRHYAQYYLVQALDARGEPIEAAMVYVELARTEADPYFLSAPPVGSLEEANEDQRGRISAEVMDVVGDTEGATRDHLTSYLRVVVGEDAMPDLNPTEQDPRTGESNPADRAASAVILPDKLWQLLESEEFDAEQWECLELLRDGKYEESIEAIQPWLNNPSDMPEKLFILARAQLALADASGEREDYLDAGLTFMRIAVHYDNTEAFAVPARLEVAYLHRMIGRDDLYQKLLFDNNLSLSFDSDPETYPEYYRRYYAIIGEPVPDASAEEDN